MNRLFAIATLIYMTLAVSATAQAFTVSKFEGEAIGAPDDYIAAEFNDELKKANPNAIQDGRFYARQKFEDPFDDAATNYGLYEGKITPAGKAKLGKFSVQGKPYSDVLKMKFYASKGLKPDQDIERAYFDGKFVYVEGAATIFANIDGVMTELKPSIEKVSYFSITTTPGGVDVSLNGESKGSTPTKVSYLGTKSPVFVLSKAGFFSKVVIAKVQLGGTVNVNESLNEKKDIENPSLMLRTKFNDLTKKKDSKGLLALRKTVATKLASWPADSKSAIDKVLANYPPNAAQGSDETADEYQSRNDAWRKDRDAEQSKQQAIADKATADLNALLSELGASADAASFALAHIYIPSTSITLGRFVKGKTQFEINVKQSGPDLSFTYKTTLDMGSFNQASIVKDKDQIQGVLKTWDFAGSSGKKAVLHAFSFYLDRTLLVEVGKGAYSSADADAESSSKGTEFERKYLGLSSSERSQFDTDDENKTQALLISFANPVPEVTPPVEAAPVEEPTEAPKSDVVDSPSVTETPIDNTVTESEARDESAGDAASDVEARFGRQDEYRTWAAWGLVASAVGNAVIGVLQHMQYNKAQTALKNTKEFIANENNNIANKCGEGPADQLSYCVDVLTARSSADEGPLAVLNKLEKDNQKISDGYSTGRTVFLALSAASIAGSVVLFTW